MKELQRCNLTVTSQLTHLFQLQWVREAQRLPIQMMVPRETARVQGAVVEINYLSKQVGIRERTFTIFDLGLPDSIRLADLLASSSKQLYPKHTHIHTHAQKKFPPSTLRTISPSKEVTSRGLHCLEKMSCLILD